jgi:hypothetical protein
VSELPTVGRVRVKEVAVMKRLGVPAILLLAVIVAGCAQVTINGSGNVVTEPRDVSGFDALALGGQGVLTITVGDEETLTVTADDNLLEHIEARVEDGRLTIGPERGSRLRPSAPIRYDLTIVGLRAIAVAGAAEVRAGTLPGDEFDIAVSGSGDVGVDRIAARLLTVAISGSGEVAVGGRAEALSVAISGSGEYRGSDLESVRASCAVSGSGDATVWVEDELDVGVSGSGSVSYYGEPSVREDVSGSGRVVGLGPRKPVP